MSNLKNKCFNGYHKVRYVSRRLLKANWRFKRCNGQDTSMSFVLNKVPYIQLREEKLINLLVKLGLHKYASAMKVTLTFATPIVLFIIDNWLIGILAFGINIISYAMIFWSLDSVENSNNFEYKKSQTVAILLAIFCNIMIILMFHYYVANFLKNYLYIT